MNSPHVKAQSGGVSSIMLRVLAALLPVIGAYYYFYGTAILVSLALASATALMAEAAIMHALPRQRISFKGAVDSLRSFTPVMLRTTSKRSRTRFHIRLLDILAADTLPVRSGRSEPRAVKMRPKHYPLLTKPRRVFKALPHNGKKLAKRPQVILT